MAVKLNTNNNQIMSSADRCGREVLNMGGSLISYINTGDPYAYDSFNPQNNLNPEQPKKKMSLKQILKWGVASIVLIAGGIFAFKKKPTMQGIKNSINTFVTNFGSKFNNFVNKLKKTKP